MSDKAASLRVRIEMDPNYRNLHINGVYGGVTPRGDIKVDFFTEHQEPPKELFFRLDEQGKTNFASPELIVPQRADIVRTHHFGMYLSPDHARSIAEWLLQKVELAVGELEKEETQIAEDQV